MEGITVRVGARTYTGAFGVRHGRLTVAYDSRLRSAEHGGMSAVSLAGMLLAGMVREDPAAWPPTPA